jgi:hypothetical protein
MTDATAASVRDIKTAIAAAADPDTGAFARTVGAALGELNAGIASLITEGDAPLRLAVARSVEELTGNALSEIQRALAGHSRTIVDTLNSDNPASPLNGLRLELLRSQQAQGDAIQAQLNELRTVIDVSAAIKQTMERTAIKGADYEDDLEVVLDRLTRGTGDRLERTGAKPGLLGRSKKGDFVARLPTELVRTHTVNVVFEAKDKTQTLPEWQAELDEARRNRGAVAALGVVKGTEHMPGGGRLRLLDPLTYVVAFDPATDSDDLLLAVYQSAAHARGHDRPRRRRRNRCRRAPRPARQGGRRPRSDRRHHRRRREGQGQPRYHHGHGDQAPRRPHRDPRPHADPRRIGRRVTTSARRTHGYGPAARWQPARLRQASLPTAWRAPRWAR